MTKMLRKHNLIPVVVTLTGILFLIAFLYAKICDDPLSFDSATTLTPDFMRQNSVPFALSINRWLGYHSFAAIYNRFGADLFWQYGFNIALHAANTLLVFSFLAQLFNAVIPGVQADVKKQNIWLACFGAAFFAFNPIAVYATAYLVERTIQMATFFTLISLLGFLRGAVKKNPAWYGIAIIGYFLAIHSKEHAIFIPLTQMLLAVVVVKTRDNNAGQNASVASFAKEFAWVFVVEGVLAYQVIGLTSGLAMKVYEPHAQAMLGIAKQNAIPLSADTAYPLSVMSQGALFFRYAFLWIVPYLPWISVDVHLAFPKSFFSWPETPGFLVFIAAFIFLARSLFSKKEKSLLAVFALLAPMTLFLTEFTTVRLAEPFALYRSYLWMPFLSAALPLLVDRATRVLPAAKKWLVPAGVIYLCLLAVIANDRIATFGSRTALWKDVITKVGGDETMTVKTYRTYNNYGHALTLDGAYDAAIYYFRKSIQINPYYTKAYSNMAAVLTTQGHYDAAKDAYQKAIALEPSFVDALVGLGVVYAETNDHEAALEYYGKALKLEPAKQDVWYNAGNAYLSLKNYARAAAMYGKALALNPNFAEAYFNMGILEKDRGDIDAARKNFDMARKLKPSLFQRVPASQGGVTIPQIITR